ncbi:heme ABC exporter ATP-binding protein CcmA [Beijerinckia sp. L45]|uniref:ABC transporter ATP-binding protein n=1 Tax=Beijerinckia sp. L45 TaxID=1641855 RepID=UPI001FED98AF|nr:heme ABC exporter ATP-binding protein CcmA [Beijerinckia sp. L45]
MIDSALLAVDALTVERGGRIVLSDLTFSLGTGEVLLVTGRNGAGKSTLLRTLAGLLPMQSGRIVFADASDEVRGVETVHYLGYEDALKPSLTVGENLTFWAAMLGPSSPAERGSGTTRSVVEGAPPEVAADLPPPPPPAVPLSRFAREDLSPRDALTAFGIARLLDLPAAYLSAGQKRRVALARLLLTPRPIWLLDEPLIALDVGAQQTLTAIMAAHVAKGGAIVAASHAPLGLPCRSIDLGGLA